MNGRISYEFADFRLVPDEELLLRNGEPIPLAPKAYRTLALLIERHGHLVKKAELIETVWGDVFVEEAVVSKCVWTIRNALGEDSKNQQFIQTVPKRGYKFIAEVTELEDAPVIRTMTNDNGDGRAVVERAFLSDDSEQTLEDVKEGVPATWKSSGAYFALAAIALAVVGTVAVYIASVGAATAGTGRQIAVLPLKPIDAANRSDIYEIGVADSLINRLNSIKGLVARPLSATRKYEALDQDPLAAGREQQVDHVIASNYQLVDGKFRLTAQLINVANGQVEESYKVETDGGNVFAIQDAVAAEIGNRLVARFGKAIGPTRKRGTTNEHAYELYLQAKNLTMRRSPAEADKAVEYLEQAIGLDPNFALAYAQMAQAYRRSNRDDNENSEKVREFINRALKLDPSLAEAFVARAEHVLINDWDFLAVEKDLAKAIELEPNNDTAHWLLALLLSNRGRYDEGLAEMEIALAIDPGAVVYMFHRGRILYYARRYDEAITQFKQAMEVDDRFMQPYQWMARLYEGNRDYAAAYQFFLKSEERSPRKDRLETYKKAFESGGLLAVRRSRADFAEVNGGREMAFFDMARLYALNGAKNEAFEYLNKALVRREWLMNTMNVEPAFDNLRGDPRFSELARRVYR